MGSLKSLFRKKINIETQKIILQLFVLFLFIVMIAGVADKKYQETLGAVTEKINKDIIQYHLEIFEELDRVFLKYSHKNFVRCIEQDEKQRILFEDMLHLVKISTMQNLFVVTKNSNDNYYFLLDGEKDPNLRADFNEPFEPLNDTWDRVYKTKKAAVFYHTKTKKLWITIIYPIVQDNRTVALIGADISHTIDTNLHAKLNEFEYFFFWIVLLAILIVIFLYLVIIYFRKKYNESYIDPLTKVKNRKYFYDVLMKKLADKYQLFMIDIDYFKKVNDDFGHDVGDVVLAEVAKRLQHIIRDEDILIRFGGEEFLLYTENLDEDKAIDLAKRLREHIKERPIRTGNLVCHITISIGINTDGSRDIPFEDVLKKADEALYRAKNEGRDCERVAR
jgi:diguanylate cyclase (GGDEF)-like protein